MNTLRLAPVLLALASLASCNSETTTNKEVNSTTVMGDSATAATGMQPAGALSFVEVPASPDFPNASLAIGSVTSAASGTDSAKVKFSFNVSGYELKGQTADASTKGCNNSAQGQHIHFILDNAPYVALYEPKHEATVAKSSEHYAMCFLSRSYHESVKAPKAGVLVHFKVDDKGVMQLLGNPSVPMLFYSRPKGDYKGADTAKVLLDFYVWNGTLGNDLKVMADVENTTTGTKGSQTFTSWKPMFVEGLGTGVAKVKLRLVDGSGNTVAGPQSEVTRENIRLAAAEPMP
ncbi:MAG: hypothetical protein EOP52_04345 [Sphingobacteriales bacterium]|nr:MAG: hypothetical protein EOP52_04345 [Sphingobacteriales bacterium]